MKRPPVIISIVLAVVLIIVGISYFPLGNTSPTELPPQEAPPAEQPAPVQESPPSPEQPAPVQESPPSPEQPTPAQESIPSTEQPVPSFEQKKENLMKAMTDVYATGESKVVTLVFTETEVNNQATRLLAQTEIPEGIPLEMESVHIDFQTDNNVLAEIRSAISVFKVTIKVKTRVGIKEGKPDVEVTDVKFGFVPLPGPLKERIAGFITQTIDDLLNQLAEGEIGGSGKVDVEFTDITIQEGKVTIAMAIKPKA